MAEDFIREQWPYMTEWQKELCCQRSKLSVSFVKEIWSRINDNTRKACCEYQDLTEEFLEEFWDRLTPDQRSTCFANQELSCNFMVRNWNRMTINDKGCFLQFHEDFMANLPLAQLPQFLTDSLDIVRVQAQRAVERSRNEGTECKN
jgi:hypothetical protein